MHSATGLDPAEELPVFSNTQARLTHAFDVLLVAGFWGAAACLTLMPLASGVQVGRRLLPQPRKLPG